MCHGSKVIKKKNVRSVVSKEARITILQLDMWDRLRFTIFLVKTREDYSIKRI